MSRRSKNNKGSETPSEVKDDKTQNPVQFSPTQDSNGNALAHPCPTLIDSSLTMEAAISQTVTKSAKKNKSKKKDKEKLKAKAASQDVDAPKNDNSVGEADAGLNESQNPAIVPTVPKSLRPDKSKNKNSSSAREKISQPKGGQGEGKQKPGSKDKAEDTKLLKQAGPKQAKKEEEDEGHKGQTKANNVNNNKPKPGKLGEEVVSKEMMRRLEENKMHVLKKPNQKFRNARYFCRLCDFHIDHLEDCQKHMEDNRHCRRKEISEVDAVLRLLPEPSDKQLEAVTLAIDKMWEVRGISREEQTLRSQIVDRLETCLRQHIPDVALYMYGSSLTGFGLQGADINVDLGSSDKDRKLTRLLTEVHTTIRDMQDSGFTQIRADFSAKVPVLRMTDEASGLVVTMAIHCYSALCSSQLLAIYSDMDVRVRKLAVTFRYWANLCGLDRQSEGFIPPQALNIMVIYFLQNLDPQVIPIICPPKVSGEDVGDFKQDRPSFLKMRNKAMNCIKDIRNKMSVGELWLRLLHFYCLDFDIGGVVVTIRSSHPVPRNVKPWNCKKLAVEDPYMVKKNITRMVNNSRIFEYWQDSIRKVYYYFGLPRDSEGKSLVSEEDLKARSKAPEEDSTVSGKSPKPGHGTDNDRTDPGPSTDSGKSTKSESSQAEKSKTSKDSAGSSDKLKATEAVGNEKEVTIKPNALMCSKQSKNSESCDEDLKSESLNVLAPPVARHNSGQETQAETDVAANTTKLPSITDPSQSSVDSGYDELTRSIKSSSDDLANASAGSTIVAGCNSVFSPDSVATGDTTFSFPSPHAATANTGSTSDAQMEQFVRDYSSDIISKAASIVTSETSLTPGRVLEDPKLAVDEAQDITKGLEQLVLSPSEGKDTSASADGAAGSQKKEGEREEAEKSCLYDFDKNYFTDGKGPVLMCTLCEKEGHLRNSCPDDELPEVLNLPEMTPKHLKILTEALNLVPDDVGLSDESIEERWNILYELEGFIQYQFEDAELTLFGSTCNGFGFDKSDMDICMTFARRRGKIDKVYVIETLARRLKHCPMLYNIQAIPTAKVPIVKFMLKHNQLEGDISLYNTLAQQNTKLLYAYSQLDPRVRVLGYTIKTFAKVCDLGDASRGSLSSYAYILMMLYYLQQVKPPVIPVLQELYKGPEKPVLMIEECDAWFMDDPSQLEELWPEKGQNQMSVAELWLGFLRFYVEEFNYKEYVVCIRQRELLTRFEKLWNGTSIAVEDPFDLSHNLGCSLTRKMNNFIFKTFINGRMLYGSPIDDNMEIFKSYQCPTDYFFDTELLSENRPPNIRGCRRCGKIGHLVRVCPLNRKDREEEGEQQRKQQQRGQQQHMNKPLQNLKAQRQPPPSPHQHYGGQGRPADRGFGQPRYNQGTPHFRDMDSRDRRPDSGGSNGRPHSAYSGGGGGGNTNRNSSATSGGPASVFYGGNRSTGYHQAPHQHHHYQQQQLYHPPHQQQQQQQQQHNKNYTVYSNSYNHGGGQHYRNNNQQQQHHHQPSSHQHQPHHQNSTQQQQQQQQQYYRQQQHQQQQLRHNQQEQQRHAVMAAANSRTGQPIQQPPPGFNMQPLMASTPRAIMGQPPPQHQHQQHGQHHHHHQQIPGYMQQQQQHFNQPRGGAGGGGRPRFDRPPPPGVNPQSQGHGGPPQLLHGAGGGMNPVVQSLFVNAKGQRQALDSKGNY